MKTNYLIIGASHAGISAIEAIRRFDQESEVAIVTAEKDQLYSPTVLPYIMTGKTTEDRSNIRPSDYFEDLNVDVIKDAIATGIDMNSRLVTFNDELKISYEKLLIATGAAAAVPPIPGIENVESHCIRSMKDATTLRDKMPKTDSAIIIGAGFIGMHSAQDLAESGVKVTIVESLNQVMPLSFDIDASRKIREVFMDKGVTVCTGVTVTRADKVGNKIVLSFSDGVQLSADMLITAAGIKPNISFLEGSDIDIDQGIIVNSRMRTSANNIWAAGDVAQAPGFFDTQKSIGGTIPSATEQGNIAGMDMAGDDYVSDYGGNLNMNTFNFFGNFAFSIGNIANHSSEEDFETHWSDDPSQNCFWKFKFKENVLTGVSAINMNFDPGILKELILSKTDLSEKKDAFIKAPLEVGRQLMRELF